VRGFLLNRIIFISMIKLSEIIKDVFVKNKKTGRKYDVKKFNQDKHDMTWDYRGSKENPNPFARKGRKPKAELPEDMPGGAFVGLTSPQGYINGSPLVKKKKKKQQEDQVNDNEIDREDMLLNKLTKSVIKSIKKEKVLEAEKRIARKPGQPANSKKHSDLYTDENPKGTIHGLKFATVEDAKSSVNKIKNSGKAHAHKIQAAVAMEQRAKAAGKSSAAAVYRRYINSIKKDESSHIQTSKSIS